MQEVLSLEDTKLLLGYCRAGRLYEIEKWIASQKSLQTHPSAKRTPLYIAAGSTGRCNTGLQFTRRRLKAQGLSRTLIQAQRDLVEMDLRVDG